MNKKKYFTLLCLIFCFVFIFTLSATSDPPKICLPKCVDDKPVCCEGQIFVCGDECERSGCFAGQPRCSCASALKAGKCEEGCYAECKGSPVKPECCVGYKYECLKDYAQICLNEKIPQCFSSTVKPPLVPGKCKRKS